MNQINSEANLIIQGALIAVMIGVFYNLMITTKVYGGIVGTAIRLFGVGILFLSTSVIEHLLVNFSIIQPSFNALVVQDLLTLMGLVFLGFGFSKLASVKK